MGLSWPHIGSCIYGEKSDGPWYDIEEGRQP